VCKIWGYRGSECEDYWFLGCDTCSLVDKCRRRGGSCIQIQDSIIYQTAQRHVYARTRSHVQQMYLNSSRLIVRWHIFVLDATMNIRRFNKFIKFTHCPLYVLVICSAYVCYAADWSHRSIDMAIRCMTKACVCVEVVSVTNFVLFMIFVVFVWLCCGAQGFFIYYGCYRDGRWVLLFRYLSC
jgi:hypothetical protein